MVTNTIADNGDGGTKTAQTKSAIAKITVIEFQRQENTPNAAFTAAGCDTGTLTGVTANMKYSTDGGTNWTDISGTSVDLINLSPCTISVVDKRNGSTTTDSAAQQITVTRAATPNLTVIQPTAAGGSGSVSMTSDHEYKLSSAATWTAAATSLPAGSYFVRVKASGTVLASANQAIDIINLYTVTFVNGGGTGTAPTQADTAAGGTFSLPANPYSKTGYTFSGWNDDTNTYPEGDIYTMPSKSVTLTAQWTMDIYTITYVLSGGTNGAGNPDFYTVASSDITLSAPTRTEYTFAGWYESAGFTGTAVTKISTGTAGDKTYYAQWTAIGGKPSGSNAFVPPETEPHGYLLKIQIDTGIDNVPAGITAADPALGTPAAVESRLKVGIDRALGAIGSVTAKNFDLLLWISQDAGATWAKATTENFPAGGITIVIPWQELGLTYEQAQHINFSVVHMFASSVNGHIPGTTESPAWTITTDGLRFTVDGLSPVAIGYKLLPVITFDANGGSTDTVSANTAQSGKPVSLPTPTRSNYTFDGWYTAAAGGDKITADTVFGTNATAYAHWMVVAEATEKDRVISPETGDDSGLAFWMSLMAASLLAMYFAWRHGHEQDYDSLRQNRVFDRFTTNRVDNPTFEKR